MSGVLDASAILAIVNGEPGAATALPHLSGGVLSLANAIEVGTKLIDKGLSFEEAWETIDLLDLALVDLDAGLAAGATDLRTRTRESGLSLADRVCLALAIREGLPAITADRAWAGLDVGCRIELIR